MITVLFLLGLHGWLIFSSLSCKLPNKKETICFYSNQTHEDLRWVAKTAISQAKKSIHMVSFGISDPTCMLLLEKKAQNHLDMKIFYDDRGSNHFQLSNHKAFVLRPTGLIHEKILITDDNRVFLGSANYTKSSLQMHDNLMIGFYSPNLARFLRENTPFDHQKYFSTIINGQKLEVLLFPDSEEKALRYIVQLLRTAKKTIFVGMFTLTHPLLVQELVQAHKRGLFVQVHVDHQSFKGASQKAVLTLKKAHIPVYSNGNYALFHHKFALIDNQTLLAGSANWTKAAFQKNHECVLILTPLNASQQKKMQQLIHVIDEEKNIIKKPFKMNRLHPNHYFSKTDKAA